MYSMSGHLLIIRDEAEDDISKKQRPRHTLRECFLAGSNTSCRNHIRSYHYEEYKARCAAALPPITMNQRCIPADVVSAEAAGKKTKGKKGVQQTLGFRKAKEFTWEEVLDAVAKHIACNNQVSKVGRIRFLRRC